MCKTSLDELVAEVLAGMVIGDIALKEPCDEAKREKLIAHRISFVLRPVNETASRAADRLLNGAYGLRAHYCNSSEEGTEANGAICRALAEAIQKGTIRTDGDISGQQVTAHADAIGESLTKSSAKVWFDAPTDRRAARFDDGEVLSDVWAQSRKDPKRVESALPKMSPQQIGVSLAKGPSVPQPIALDVKAAFIAPNGMEYVPASKKTRALQIHLMGWT